MPPKLSPREIEMLHFLADGLTCKRAAKELDVSPRTIEKHRANVLKKLGAKTLAQAVFLACRAGVFDVRLSEHRADGEERQTEGEGSGGYDDCEVERVNHVHLNTA